uniref:Uncharacterized protein n=1 Tax=Chromera velia CCMP2878 TaxID=1169474 RepID=A0A0G4IF23_9ALVE|eukprot:Cvel_13781.t1-p1 / transcript=Cvel_13781.t1 / gene=Cvel_13781 / organism=Chromera_velia_CCMP2878 / gene_product=hypothetical protein / transcript_product=hypothetical protein / location=Cvel_scaffold955:2606-4548(+) / protein_length=528 / sequence_SO=supercontig / SO=protein_coding / is_pseudo=false
MMPLRGPIGVALPGQVQEGENGNENEGVQPATDEAPPDGIPPDDSLFESDLLRNQDNQVVREEDGESGERSGEGSVRSQGLQALGVLEFKKGSTQLSADPVDVKAGKFDTALRDEWLLNICGQEVFGKEVKKEEVKAKRLTVINLGARFTWKEKEGAGAKKDGKTKENSEKERQAKARAFGKGYLDKRKLDTYTGTPVPSLIFLCVIWALALCLQMFVDGLVKHHRGEMQFGKLSRLNMGAYRFKYAGMDCEGDRGQCRVSMSSYLEGVDTEKLFQEFKIHRTGVGATSSCKEKELELQEGEETDPSLEKVYSSVIGCLGWGVRLSPFHRVWYDILARYRKKLTKRYLAIVIKILYEIKKNPEGLFFRRLSHSTLLKLVFFVDSSYEKDRYEGRHAWIGLLIDLRWKPEDKLFNLFTWSSMRSTVKLNSLRALELVGWQECLKRVPRLISFARTLQKDMPVEFLIDCDPLYNQIRSGVAERDTGMQHILDWCIQRCRQVQAKVVWILRAIQAANGLTKLLAFGESIYT